jgi:hypothetical protein
MKFNFAHLFGGGPRKASKVAKPAKAEKPVEEEDEPAASDDDDEAAGDDDDPDAEGEDDEKAEDKEEEATGDDDDPDAEEEPEDEEAKATKLAANKKASLDKRLAAARKAGRLAERRRIGTILGDRAATGRIDLALSLATNSSMSAANAIKSLQASPKTSVLSARMAAADPDVGPDKTQSSKAGAGRLLAAADKLATSHKERTRK